MYKRLTGLKKLAQYFPTVGDVMNRVNADMTLSVNDKKNFVTAVNQSGMTVNQPGFKLPYVVGGGIAGHSLAKYLGAKPFWDGVYTLGGMLYGNGMYNQTHNVQKPLWMDPFRR